MIAHRLVEVHAVQNWRIESCQQLFGDDENLRVFAFANEILADFCLLILAEIELAQDLPVALRSWYTSSRASAKRASASSSDIPRA